MMLEKLRFEQDRYDIIERKWIALVNIRNCLIDEWREKYEKPINGVMRLRFELKKDDKDYQQKYDAFTYKCEELIQIRRDSREAKQLRNQMNKAIKGVAKYLPVYENAGIKFRLLQREYMASVLGKHYN